MKLLFVFTGGTIGSTQNGNVISTDAEKSYKIIDAYQRKYKIDFEYDTVEPYTELSENNTGKHIKRLVTCIKQNASKGYDGIIVTHGTDTLQYSAAAIGYCLGLNSVPVCVVSANYPIEDERSNAMDNLHGAISFIGQGGGKGAFVVYRNANSNIVRVHRATRLIGPKAYSDDVSSVRGIVYGCFDKNFNFQRNSDYFERNDECALLDVESLEEQSREIALISIYPAMVYPHLHDSIKYVLLNTYHSGTLNTKAQATVDFLNMARDKNITVYATGISDGAQYSSAQEFDRLSIAPIKNLSPVSAYVKLWLLSSMKKEPAEFINLSICGDIVDIT